MSPAETHHYHCTSNASSSDGNSSEPPPTPSHTHSKLLHCRRRVHCRAYCHCRRENRVGRIFLRRKVLRYLLLLPLLYFSGLITCVGPLIATLRRPSPLPGSVYRSHEIFQKLLHDIKSDSSSAIELSAVWRYKMKLKEQKSCLKSTPHPLGTRVTDQYLIVEANGGLNQQRAAICNAVAVAKLLNATLLIPLFDFHNVWKDPSEFGDIYDEDHFIATLKDYVKVVRELPKELMAVYDSNISNIPNFRVEAFAPASYYMEVLYPVLQEKRIVRVAPFANRLAMTLPPPIQYLRCLANYEALRFSSPIKALAKTLVDRMIESSSRSGGKYVSIHLRFEEDMVAFSCCFFDGGEAENLEMDLMRRKGWGEKFKHKDRVIAPGLNRINGRCPMTPLEPKRRR